MIRRSVSPTTRETAMATRNRAGSACDGHGGGGTEDDLDVGLGVRHEDRANDQVGNRGLEGEQREVEELFVDRWPLDEGEDHTARQDSAQRAEDGVEKDHREGQRNLGKGEEDRVLTELDADER